jgi:PAT family beta-lactamase induction signal transducer AmpG
MEKSQARTPWLWVPTLYFGQGLPYVVVMMLSTIMYKNYHLSNTDIALYTSWLYLPWVIKPLWSPLIDMYRTKRFWIVSLQLLIGASLALVALTTSLPHFFQLSLAVLWLMAFSSATHDIAADGFYMLGMPQHQQAAFVGLRSTFYKLAVIAGQGGLVYLAGELITSTGSVQLAWSVVFYILAAIFGALFLYHQLVLPRPASDHSTAMHGNVVADFADTFATFFRKKHIGLVLAFLLLFRFGEAQSLKLATPFMLDSTAEGGLGLTTSQVGLVYGSIGMLALTLGGLLGGVLISRFGLKRCLWLMVAAIHLPNLVFVYLAFALPANIYLIGATIAIEQFGYGFGFTAYLMYMIMVSDGVHKTAHYAICTGFMALGMMLPGMASGWIQQQLGYQHFFVWVCVATIPAFLLAAKLEIDPGFGKRAVPVN